MNNASVNLNIYCIELVNLHGYTQNGVGHF